MESDELSENNSYNDEDSSCENDPLEEVLLGKTVLEIPESFCCRKEVFTQVLSFETWENVLSQEQVHRLSRFLPTFPENDEEEKKKTVKKLFSGENFKFGNPLTSIFEQLKAGYFSPDIALAKMAVKVATYREYKHQQNAYHFRLLRQVLISRKKLLDAAHMLPPDDPVKMQQFTAKPKNAILCERTRLRYFSILQDVREECGELETSSEDENYPESTAPKITRKHKKQLQMLEASLSPEMTRVMSTTAFPPGYPGSSHYLNRCLDMIEVSDDRYREMLLTHRRKKTAEPTHPELDTSKVDLNSMIARANLPKRPLVKPGESHQKKKPKPPEQPEKVLKTEPERVMVDIKPALTPVRQLSHDDILSITNVEKCAETPLPVLQEKDLRAELKAIKMEMEDEPMCDSNFRMSPTVPDVPQLPPTSFFSVLRDMFCEMPEQKLPAVKLEEKVRAWQEGPTAVIHDWIYLHNLWSELVPSALKFLAGDLISILPENFVPFLDYKEKQQQWQWIGSGRDSDEELYSLCQHWLENKDDVSLDILETSQGSPPPPRVTTEWTVRATSDGEKAAYQEQERIRYQNPHRAFTFKVHGYESVVGPVKGVYGKESGVNKAREHSLLVSDRPPFVTILSLVRDAAARLPNGEGTRADICELLKDSQYLAPASDQQIHTVVSGALDRLHYEKDPCVKYDVNRKLWIYLHRNRTEGEFERIHQAQAAAAKARKAVQKSKLPKSKTKDIPRTPPSASCTTVAENVAAILNVDVAATVSPSSITHSPRGSGSPRTQGSPKQGHPSSGRHAARNLPSANQAHVKASTSALPENCVAPRKIEYSNSNLVPALGHISVPASICVSSPQHSIVSGILPQSQSEGNNSRPPSQGSVQSLPSPKTVIANVNAAQFVGVGALQVGHGTEQPASSSTTPSCISVLSVDMKPSSPSFFGQPPVLQPVLSRQTMVTTSSFTCASTAVAPSVPTSPARSAPRPSKTVSPAAASKVVPGFQTIVIKPDPSLRAAAGVSTLPLLSMEEIPSSAESAVLSQNPVVARLLQSSHLISLGNIMGDNVPTTALKQGVAAQHQNLQIQKANIGQQVLQTAAIGNPQAVQVSSGPDVKIPRLSLVTQDVGREDPVASLAKARQETATLVSSIPLAGQAALFSTAAPPTASVATKVSSAHKEATEVKRMNVASQTTHGMLRPSLADLSHILDCGGAPNQTITSSGAIISSPSTSSSHISYSKVPQTVVRGTQEALKQLPSTYVMTTPITNAAGLTAQHGLRTAAPLNMRALQSIKVIPVPQSLGSNKNLRNAPLLAHIISPSAGVTVRTGVPSDFIQTAHQLKGASNLSVLHGLQAVTSSSSHVNKPSSHPPTSHEVPSSQPFIIQVQAPKASDGEPNL